MQEVVAITGGERAFCGTPLVGVKILPLVAVIVVGQSKVTPDAARCGGKQHRTVIKKRYRPGVVFHCGCGERRFADLLAFRAAFDTAGDGLCGLVGARIAC